MRVPFIDIRVEISELRTATLNKKSSRKFRLDRAHEPNGFSCVLLPSKTFGFILGKPPGLIYFVECFGPAFQRNAKMNDPLLVL